MASTAFALIAAGLPFPDNAASAAPAPILGASSAKHELALPVDAQPGAVVFRPVRDPDLLYGAASTPDVATVDAAAARYRDSNVGISVLPPRGWVVAPLTSLDQTTDDQAFEVARFQMRIGDAALYAQPIAVTSGLLNDAKAILSIALAREGSDLAAVDPSALGPDGNVRLHGGSAIDGESSYEGVTTVSRVLVTTSSHRVALIRAYVPSADRDALGPQITAAIASVTLDRDGPSGPKYVAPEPPAPPEPQAVEQSVATPPDPSAEIRGEILARAGLMLGTPYVWGGNSPGHGMDCSAYVSAAWGVARYTTNSIWDVAVPVAKADLLPGDAMDLETWRDPDGYGHIRLFDAWADAAHTLAWVYEETPPRAIHRVIAYDDSYQPMRLSGLSDVGAAPLIPAPAPQPVPHFDPGSGWKNAGSAPSHRVRQPQDGHPWWWQWWESHKGQLPPGTKPPATKAPLHSTPPKPTPHPTPAHQRSTPRPKPTARPRPAPRPSAPPSADQDGD